MFLSNTSLYFPGLPVYHSKDMVNWELISYAMNKRSQLDLIGVDSGRGLFAPTIRHNNIGKIRKTMENLSYQRISVFLSGLIFILSSCVTKQEEQFANIATVDWKDGVDSRALGKADLSGLAFYALSQVNVNEYDSQIMQLKPDMNIRVWQRFRRHGTELSHYNQESIKSYKDASVLFVGGTTSSALFSEEDDFLENVSIDSYGKPVVHQYFDHDLSRGNLANPSYRDYLLKISKMQHF